MLPTISAVSGPQLGPVVRLKAHDLGLVRDARDAPMCVKCMTRRPFVRHVGQGELLVAHPPHELMHRNWSRVFKLLLLLGNLRFCVVFCYLHSRIAVTRRWIVRSGNCVCVSVGNAHVAELWFVWVSARCGLLRHPVTKVKMAQKEAQGVAEKRKGRRGPGSVIGSSAAGCICALVSIYGAPTDVVSHLLKLGFVASFCTKLSDTVSSEIGKAYGKITYLVTTLKVVPRGTEGAVSLEGTLAGLVAAALLAYVGCYLNLIKPPEAMVCIIASQIANVGESIIGATLQEKEGFQWLNNDLVNVINISMGSIVAVMIQQLLMGSNLKAFGEFSKRSYEFDGKFSLRSPDSIVVRLEFLNSYTPLLLTAHRD
ncbi:unnamed protein product [Rhodiola kirilowii]